MATEEFIREQIARLLDDPVTDATLDQMTWGFMDICGPYEPVRLPVVQMLAQAFIDDVEQAGGESGRRPLTSIRGARTTAAVPSPSARHTLAIPA